MNLTRLALLSALFVAFATGQTNSPLPPRIAALVPQGAKVSSQSSSAGQTLAAAGFSASKSIAAGRSVAYQLDIHIYDNNSPLWGMLGPIYRQQMEARIAEKRSGLITDSFNHIMFTADPVKEVKYGWGSGLTQRVLRHPPQAKQYVDYQCAYFGMIGGTTFELFVSGLPDAPDEGNQWAQKVAEAAAKLTLTTIKEK